MLVFSLCLIYLGVKKDTEVEAFSLIFIFIKIFNDDFIVLEGGERRGRERERNIDVQEKHQLVAPFSHTPSRGPGLQPRHVPWPGTEPATFWSVG